MSETGQTKKPPYQSRTGSSRGYHAVNGDVIAIPHKLPKSSSGPRNEATRVPRNLSSTMKDSYTDPNQKRALTPYHPLAPRNRLPVRFDNEAKPHTRFCQARNVSSFAIDDTTNNAGFQRFLTTNQNFFNYDTRTLEVGQTNAGIVSEKSKFIHLQQTK